MRRREFITLLGGAAAASPLIAHAQQSDPVRRIAVLMNTAADDVEGQERVSAFLRRLHGLGWTEGKNVHVDTRWASGMPGGYRKSATELVELKPEVILATGSRSGAFAGSDQHHPNCIRECHRPDRCWFCRQSGQTRGQCDRFYPLRVQHGRKMAGVAQGDRSPSYASSHPARPATSA